MNLLLLAVWYAVVSCTLSVPRPRHSHIIYPTIKPQNPHRELTALEVLERKLLQPGKQYLQKRSLKNKRTLNLKSVSSPFLPEDKFHPLRKISHLTDENDVYVDKCSASFGNQSPLCRPRRVKKSPKKSYNYIQHYFQTIRPFVGTNTTVEDFFGIFNSSNSASLVQTTVELTTFNTIGSFNSSSAIFSTTKNLFNESVSSQDLVSSSPYLSTGPMTILDKFKPSFEDSNEYSVRINDMPSSLTTLRSGPQIKRFLQTDSPKHDLKGFFEESPNNELVDDENSLPGILVDEKAAQTSASRSTESTLHKLPLSEKSKKTIRQISLTKDQCESASKKKCICHFASFKSNLTSVFSEANSLKTVIEQVSKVYCKRYIPKPNSFELNSHRKPKVLTANKKPLAINNDRGPKEVDESSFDDIFNETSYVEEGALYVFVNTDIKLPCVPTNDVHLSSTYADNVNYRWVHTNQKAVSEGRLTENTDEDGSLTIEDVTLTDSNNYTCDLEYINPDTGHRTEETFVHVVEVVTLPIVTVRASVHYRSSASCDAAIMEMFELYLPRQVEEAICSASGGASFCSVDVHNPVCHSESSKERVERALQPASNQKPFWLRQKREDSSEMSLNLEVYTLRTAERTLISVNSSVCDPKCHLVVSLKLTQLFGQSMQEVALTPVSAELENTSRLFDPVTSSVKVRYIFGCIGGYRLDYGFCVACPENTYSEDGTTECTPCPPHTYQGDVGARRCISCDNAWIPACNEYVRFTNMTVIAVVLLIVSVPLVIFSLCYFYSFKRKKTDVEDFTRKKAKKNSRTDTLEEVKSSNLRQQHLEELKEQLQELLDSSTGASEAEETEVDQTEESEPENKAIYKRKIKTKRVKEESKRRKPQTNRRRFKSVV